MQDSLYRMRRDLYVKNKVFVLSFCIIYVRTNAKYTSDGFHFAHSASVSFI